MPGDLLGTRRIARFVLLSLTLVVSAAGFTRVAVAQIGSDRYASLVIEARSGTVLTAANADEYRYPASLTKLMTIYILFEALRDHRVALTDAVPVSSSAASMPPTKLGLLPGMSITVEQALLALVTKSANDAAAALGEMLGGDEDRFAEMMTLRARGLGMTRTTFRNASGLPDWGQVTTARDMAVLARHLITDFPNYYFYFSTPSFVFHGRTILNHQRLLDAYPGADGLKTGYIGASGYNVVTSAVRGNVRLIGVVMGGATGWERDQHMASLLDQGFSQMGVPVEVARVEPPSYRLSLMASAHAAPLPRYVPLQTVDARPRLRADLARRGQSWQAAQVLRPQPVMAGPIRAYLLHTLPQRPSRVRATRTAHTPAWPRYPG